MKITKKLVYDKTEAMYTSNYKQWFAAMNLANDKMKEINKNEIKKDLYKSKVFATFTKYQGGMLYYKVLLFGTDIYEFPISVVEAVADEHLSDYKIQLSSDIGDTAFMACIKGSELIRYITKAIDDDHFIELESMETTFSAPEELKQVMSYKEAMTAMDVNPKLEKAWYLYRCDNPASVGSYQEYLPKFVTKWLKENG